MAACCCRGLDKSHFRQFLQCWALLHMEPLYKVAKELEPALSRPLDEFVRSQQVGRQPREALSMCHQHDYRIASVLQPDVALSWTPCPGPGP